MSTTAGHDLSVRWGALFRSKAFSSQSITSLGIVGLVLVTTLLPVSHLVCKRYIGNVPFLANASHPRDHGAREIGE